MDFVLIENAELDQQARVPVTAVQYLGAGWKVVGDAPDPTGPPPPPPPFDPGEHTVAEVQAYLDYATPEERDRVLDAEKNGKARAGLLNA